MKIKHEEKSDVRDALRRHGAARGAGGQVEAERRGDGAADGRGSGRGRHEGGGERRDADGAAGRRLERDRRKDGLRAVDDARRRRRAGAQLQAAQAHAYEKQAHRFFLLIYRSTPRPTPASKLRKTPSAKWVQSGFNVGSTWAQS